MKKTELEKKWEEEDEEEVIEVSAETPDEGILKVSVKGIDGILVMFFLGSDKYVGVISEEPEGSLCANFPLLFMEVPVETPDGKKGIVPIFRKIINCIDLMGEFHFHGDYGMYFLDNAKAKDRSLAELYQNYINEYSASDAGVIAPTAKDAALIRKQ